MGESLLVGTERRRYSPPQVRLIRRAVCAQLTDAEFDHFMEVAETARLDPLRRQISPLVLGADDPARRRMVPWTTIDGLRVIAARAGDYRPMEEAPALVSESGRIDPACNPLGLVRAEVRVWKGGAEGRWHGVAGEAWWDEYAPVRTASVRSDGGDVSVIELDPAWRRMGRVMLAKCAEALALRRGWPDLLSGLYAEDELHRVRVESASERAAQAEAAQSAHLLAGSGALTFVFDEAVEAVPRSGVVARLCAFYRAAGSAEAIQAFNERNRSSLQTLWSLAPEGAMAAKQAAEEQCAALAAKQRKKRSRGAASPALAARGRAHAGGVGAPAEGGGAAEEGGAPAEGGGAPAEGGGAAAERVGASSPETKRGRRAASRRDTGRSALPPPDEPSAAQGGQP